MCYKYKEISDSDKHKIHNPDYFASWAIKLGRDTQRTSNVLMILFLKLVDRHMCLLYNSIFYIW